MRLNILFQNTGANDGAMTLKIQDYAPISIGPISIRTGPSTSGAIGQANGVEVQFTPRWGAELWANSPANAGGAGVLSVAAIGFNHRVNRICAGY